MTKISGCKGQKGEHFQTWKSLHILDRLKYLNVPCYLCNICRSTLRQLLFLSKYVTKNFYSSRATFDQRPTTDLASWKISNGHISVTGHPIHFMFGSMVGFSGRPIECLYFRLDQIQDGGRPSSWTFSNDHISATGHPIHFMFVLGYGFRGRWIEWPYVRLDQIQDRGRQPSCIILNGHISETVHPIQFVFGFWVKV